MVSCLVFNLHALVTETVACLVSVGELAWLLICTVLVADTVACFISGSELAWVSMCTSDRDFVLSCFRM